MKARRRLAILLAVWPAAVACAEVTWTPGGSSLGGDGVWDTSTPNFTSNDQPFTWSNASPVPVFFPGAGGVISFGNSPITASQGIRFNDSSNYTFAASTAAAGGSGSSSTLGTINFGTSSINVPANTTATILTKFNGTNSVTKLGDGILTFGIGANPNGNTTVAAGTLILGGNSTSGTLLAIGSGASAVIASQMTFGNVFAAGSGSILTIPTNGRLQVSGTTLNIAPTLVLNGGFSLPSGTFSGTMSGNGTFTKSATGTILINPSGPGVTAFTGALVATAGTGTLKLSDSFTGSYTPTISIRNGNTLAASTTPLVTNTPSLGSSGVVNGYVTIIDSTVTFGGGVKLSDNLIHSFTINGTLDLRGNKPLTMSFDIGTAGADVLNVTTLNATNPAGETVHMTPNGVTFNPGTYTLIHTTNGLNGVYSLDSPSIGGQLLSLSTDPTGHDLQLTVTGPPTLPHSSTWSPSTGTFGGTGTWDLTTTAFSSGSSQTAWSNTGTTAALFSGNGTVNVSGAIRAGGGVFLDHDSSYTFAGGTSNSLDVSGTGIFTTLASATFNVSLSGTSGLMVASNGGTVTLAAPSTYTGGTTVASGTLVVVPGGTLGASAGPLVVEDAVALGTSQMITSLSGTGTGKVMMSNSAVLNVNSSGDCTFSGQLSGSGTILKTGAGTLAINSSTILSSAADPVALAVNGGSFTGTAPGMSFFTSLASTSAATTLSDSTIGSIDIEKGAMVNITGSLTIDGTSAQVTSDLSAGQIHVASLLAITAPTLVMIDSGSLDPGDYPLFTYGNFTGNINDPAGLHLGTDFGTGFATPSAAGNSMTLFNDPLTHTIGVRIVAIPEPGSGILALGISLLLGRRRTRRME